jgi:hypothetical protein
LQQQQRRCLMQMIQWHDLEWITLCVLAGPSVAVIIVCAQGRRAFYTRRGLISISNEIHAADLFISTRALICMHTARKSIDFQISYSNSFSLSFYCSHARSFVRTEKFIAAARMQFSFSIANKQVCYFCADACA